MGCRRHVPRSEPRWPTRRAGQSGRPRQVVRPRHVPLPLGRGSARRASPRLHRHRRLCPLQAHDRGKRPARPRLRQLRVAGRTARDRHRHPPAHQHRIQHRQHAPPVAQTRTRPRRAPQREHDRRGLLQVDAVDLLADLQLVVRRRSEACTTDRRADRRVCLRLTRHRHSCVVGTVRGRTQRPRQ